jgi:hypothetical protein
MEHNGNDESDEDDYGGAYFIKNDDESLAHIKEIKKKQYFHDLQD